MLKLEFEDLEPWEQLPHESRQAFQAFALFRDQPTLRSKRKVATSVGKGAALIQRWMTRWSWHERVRLYDLHVDELARRGNEKQILDFRRRAVQQARAKAQSLMLADMVISGRLEAARTQGQDLMALFAGVTMRDLVRLSIEGGRVLAALLGAEGDALGITPGELDLPQGANGSDFLTQRIQASDELRGLLAVVVERATTDVGDLDGSHATVGTESPSLVTYSGLEPESTH